jgi:hypothetical protein
VAWEALDRCPGPQLSDQNYSGGRGIGGAHGRDHQVRTVLPVDTAAVAPRRQLLSRRKCAEKTGVATTFASVF